MLDLLAMLAMLDSLAMLILAIPDLFAFINTSTTIDPYCLLL